MHLSSSSQEEGNLITHCLARRQADGAVAIWALIATAPSH